MTQQQYATIIAALNARITFIDNKVDQHNEYIDQLYTEKAELMSIKLVIEDINLQAPTTITSVFSGTTDAD